MKLHNLLLTALLVGGMSFNASAALIDSSVTPNLPVNDKVEVHNGRTPVKLPIPASLFLLAPALAGFVGLRRRKKTNRLG